jgi:hypothetical protein
MKNFTKLFNLLCLILLAVGIISCEEDGPSAEELNSDCGSVTIQATSDVESNKGVVKLYSGGYSKFVSAKYASVPIAYKYESIDSIFRHDMIVTFDYYIIKYAEKDTVDSGDIMFRVNKGDPSEVVIPFFTYADTREGINALDYGHTIANIKLNYQSECPELANEESIDEDEVEEAKTSDENYPLPVLGTLKSKTSSSFIITGNGVVPGSKAAASFGLYYSAGESVTKVPSTGSLEGFELEVSGLKEETEYMVRAYAVQDDSTIYSDDYLIVKTDTREIVKPNVTVGSEIKEKTSSSFTIAGNMVDGGNPAPTGFGVAYALENDSTKVVQKLASDGSASGYEASVTGLDANTEYFVWAYAVQEGVTIYSASSTSVTTSVEAPTVTVGATVSNITSTSFTIAGNTVDGGSPAPTEFGVAYATTDNSANSQKVSSAGSASGYEVSVTGLDPETTYFVWAYAVQDGNTIYSSASKQVVTEAEVPAGTTVTFNGQEYTIDGGTWNEFFAGEILFGMYRQGDGFQDFNIGITLVSTDPNGIISGTYTFNGSGLKFDNTTQVSTTNSNLESTFYDATGGTIILTIEANGDYTLEMDFTTTGGTLTGTYTVPKIY